MNIFVTSNCPQLSAQYLDDKRVIKMILESAQMLSTTINYYGGDGPYKSTHQNHPCSIWARQSQGNYMWLLLHFEFLCDEYRKRYGDHKKHKSESYLQKFYDGLLLVPEGDLTPFANCAAHSGLGLSFKHLPVTEAYKTYLTERWKNDKKEPKWYGHSASRH